MLWGPTLIYDTLQGTVYSLATLLMCEDKERVGDVRRTWYDYVSEAATTRNLLVGVPCAATQPVQMPGCTTDTPGVGIRYTGPVYPYLRSLDVYLLD